MGKACPDRPVSGDQLISTGTYAYGSTGSPPFVAPVDPLQTVQHLRQNADEL